MSDESVKQRLRCWLRLTIRTCPMVCLLGCLTVVGVRAEPEEITPARIRSAVERALPLLQKSLVVYAEKRDCFSCHHQAVSLVALEIARSRGLAIDEDAFQGAVALTLADLESALEPYRKGRGQPGGVTRAAYALWTLEAGGHPADETTAAVTNYLLKADRDRDHWTDLLAGRPPIEASPFTATALALRGLGYYGSKGQADVVKDRVGQARAWLAKSRPADTEDRVFRLWGLKYAAATPDELEAAAKDLLAAQRERRRLGPDRQAGERRVRDRLRDGGAAPGRRTLDRRPRLPPRGRLPAAHAEGRRDLVRGLAEPAVPALLRERLPLRQGPVHRGGRERLGRRGAGPGTAGRAIDIDWRRGPIPDRAGAGIAHGLNYAGASPRSSTSSPEVPMRPHDRPTRRTFLMSAAAATAAASQLAAATTATAAAAAAADVRPERPHPDRHDRHGDHRVHRHRTAPSRSPASSWSPPPTCTKAGGRTPRKSSATRSRPTSTIARSSPARTSTPCSSASPTTGTPGCRSTP